MANEARHHHYISECYLRNFSVKQRKKRLLTVYSLSDQRVFETNPRNVGGIRDFNRVNVPGLEPDAVEKGWSDFEGQAANSIRNLSSTARFDGDDREVILHLIALFSVRSPQFREVMRKFTEDVSKSIMDLTLAKKSVGRTR